MTKSESQKLMIEVKEELDRLRKAKCNKFPIRIWDKLHKLTKSFSRQEIMEALTLSSSQIHKAIQLNSKNIDSFSKKDDLLQFVKVDSSEELQKDKTITVPHCSNLRRKVILELKTSSGMTISIFE